MRLACDSPEKAALPAEPFRRRTATAEDCGLPIHPGAQGNGNAQGAEGGTLLQERDREAGVSRGQPRRNKQLSGGDSVPSAVVPDLVWTGGVLVYQPTSGEL